MSSSRHGGSTGQLSGAGANKDGGSVTTLMAPGRGLGGVQRPPSAKSARSATANATVTDASRAATAKGPAASSLNRTAAKSASATVNRRVSVTAVRSPGAFRTQPTRRLARWRGR